MILDGLIICVLGFGGARAMGEEDYQDNNKN
jgi:hypothetical protein